MKFITVTALWTDTSPQEMDINVALISVIAESNNEEINPIGTHAMVRMDTGDTIFVKETLREIRTKLNGH